MWFYLRKSEKVKEDSVENVFPRKKANYEILWRPYMTQEIIPFLCQVLFLWIFHFFHPPLKLFYPAQVNKFPFHNFIRLADRLRR